MKKGLRQGRLNCLPFSVTLHFFFNPIFHCCGRGFPDCLVITTVPYYLPTIKTDREINPSPFNADPDWALEDNLDNIVADCPLPISPKPAPANCTREGNKESSPLHYFRKGNNRPREGT